jgi:hypothetical protein
MPFWSLAKHERRSVELAGRGNEVVRFLREDERDQRPQGEFHSLGIRPLYRRESSALRGGTG